MALAVTPNLQNQTNSVMILASSPTGAALRVVSLVSGSLGTLVASGAASVQWKIVGAPTWVTLSISLDTLTCTINFTSAQTQTNPYQFYISCSVGTSTVFFPILLEVAEPFFAAVPSNTTNILNITGYDSTSPDIEINGYGLNDNELISGVRFIQPPGGLSTGLSLVTTEENGALLRVAQPAHVTYDNNNPGGLQQAGVTPLTLQAYSPGSFYDTPQRAYTVNFTIQSLTNMAGTLDVGVGCYYNTTNSNIELDAVYDWLEGQGPTLTYNWQASCTGSLTAILSAATGPHVNVTVSGSGNGNLTVVLTMLNGAATVVDTITIGPFPVTVTAGSWASSDAIKLTVNDDILYNYAGQQVTFTVSADVQSLETVTVDFVVTGASGLETPISNPAPITLTRGSPSANVTLTLPASGPNQKWNIAAQANNGSPAMRMGFAQFVVESYGLPVQTIAVQGGNTISSNTGTSVSVGLSTGQSPVFRLVGAPDGLLIENDELVGNALTPGTYHFQVSAEEAGYALSVSPTITLNVSALALPLALTSPVASFPSPYVTAVPDNTQFNINWGYSGTPESVTLEQNFTVRDVTGVTQVTTSEVGSSVVSVFGTSYYGNAYAVPLFVLSTSAAASTQLQDAPTIAVIDQNFFLTVNWQPVLYAGDQTYSIYKDWDIYLDNLTQGTGPQLQSLSTGLPTGLEPSGSSLSNRLFEEQIIAGDYTMSMTALSTNAAIAQNAPGWDAFHEFPSALTVADVAVSLATAEIGEPVTITLSPLYTGADTWQIVFSDGTTSGSLPITINTYTKTFNTSGNITITVLTERDYTDETPQVRLRRQVTLTLYVSSTVFVAPGSAVNQGVTSTVGFGGPAGFEITNVNTGPATEPYELIVRSLVRDLQTNELKLMVATSRFQDASSLLGTMAVDVFPLQGRPRDKEPIDLAQYLTVQSNTSAVPVSVQTQQTNIPLIYVGRAMAEFQLTAQGGNGPYTWYSDDLPFGLKLTTNGVLSGTLLALGTSAVHFSVSDQSEPPFIAEATLSLIAVSDLAISTTALPRATVCTNYNFQMTAGNTNPTALTPGGIPPYQWEVVGGSLPIGLTLDPGTGIIAGIPSTYNSVQDFAKPFSVTIQVTDSIGAQVQTVLTMTLMPAALTLGAMDQPTIFAGQEFKIVVPVFGGASPYGLTSFTEPTNDVVIGTGLDVVNPQILDVVGGISSPALTVTSGPTIFFFPEAYPANGHGITIEFPLTATGGVPNDTAPFYRFFIDPSGNTTLQNPAIFGDILIGTPTADGTYQVALKCIDSVGHIASTTLTLVIQSQSYVADPSPQTVGTYVVRAVTINQNGARTNPGAWTVTPIAALPDAVNGASYQPGVGTYYGLCVYKSGVKFLTNSEPFNPMTSQVINGSIPAGMKFVTGNQVVYGNSAPSTDYSGIVFINYPGYGGANPATNGGFSFEFEFSNVDVSATQTVSRESIFVSVTVAMPGTTTTPVVVLSQINEVDINLTIANGTPYGWFYPLVAEGGLFPYTFTFLSGTTLPGATIINYGNGVAITSSSSVTGSYTVVVQATDQNGVQSAPTSIAVVLSKTTAQPISILTNNLPMYLYAGRPIPPNTYFVEANLLATWTATNLPAGVTLSTAPSQNVYLSGTPTSTGVFNITFTATSVVYGTQASTTIQFSLKARTASITAHPASVTLDTAYRVVSNNSVLAVTYVGYQPTDSDLPTLSSLLAQSSPPGAILGSPSISGTTGNLNLTTDGFVMLYDYTPLVIGAETITLSYAGSPPTTWGFVSFNVVYSTLQAVGQNVSVSVNATATTGVFNPPVTVSGGNPPYVVSLIGFSDARFSAVGGKVQITVSNFTPGGTYACIVSMTVTDTESPTPQSVTVSGTLNIMILP